MNSLGIIDRLLKEVAFPALRPLDCHCELVHNGVEEADENEPLPIGRVFSPIYWHYRERIANEDERKCYGVERRGNRPPCRVALLLVVLLLLLPLLLLFFILFLLLDPLLCYQSLLVRA